jgi:hypothetical protein
MAAAVEAVTPVADIGLTILSNPSDAVLECVLLKQLYLTGVIRTN